MAAIHTKQALPLGYSPCPLPVIFSILFYLPPVHSLSLSSVTPSQSGELISMLIRSLLDYINISLVHRASLTE